MMPVHSSVSVTIVADDESFNRSMGSRFDRLESAADRFDRTSDHECMDPCAQHTMEALPNGGLRIVRCPPLRQSARQSPAHADSTCACSRASYNKYTCDRFSRPTRQNINRNLYQRGIERLLTSAPIQAPSTSAPIRCACSAKGPAPVFGIVAEKTPNS